MKLEPCWVKCPACEDYWCKKHWAHVYDCSCPPIEEWFDQEVNPYVEDED